MRVAVQEYLFRCLRYEVEYGVGTTTLKGKFDRKHVWLRYMCVFTSRGSGCKADLLYGRRHYAGCAMIINTFHPRHTLALHHEQVEGLAWALVCIVLLGR